MHVCARVRIMNVVLCVCECVCVCSERSVVSLCVFFSEQFNMCVHGCVVCGVCVRAICSEGSLHMFTWTNLYAMTVLVEIALDLSHSHICC